jgi:hypothetical protein
VAESITSHLVSNRITSVIYAGRKGEHHKKENHHRMTNSFVVS